MTADPHARTAPVSCTAPATYTTIDAASSPSFSCDGRTLFHLRGAGLTQVWALDLDSDSAQQLTFHDERVALLRRAPGDDRLIYGIDAGGDERQQLWLLEDGQSRPLTDAPGVIHGFGAWSPDGSRISLTANDRDEAHFDVLLLDPATGERTRLFQGTHEATAAAWHPSGVRLAALLDRNSGDQRPMVLHMDGAVQAVPRAAPARYASLRWTPDGAALMGLTDAGRDDMALCCIDPASGEATPVFAPPGRDVEAWALAPGGGLLATVENDRGYALLRVGPVDGTVPWWLGCRGVSCPIPLGRRTVRRWPSPPVRPLSRPAFGCGGMARCVRCGGRSARLLCKTSIWSNGRASTAAAFPAGSPCRPARRWPPGIQRWSGSMAARRRRPAPASVPTCRRCWPKATPC